ncbi:DUF2240 domain-containing protein [Halobacteriales archaeon SW_7_68_16]|nr:MAG: DUF2240 domain-containing protein [Halobacteriales archaeon SW_7_68_16]
MTLRRTVAVPFRTRGVDRLGENEFLVAVSIEREWFSPDQAQRLIDRATAEGLVERDDDGLRLTFDPATVEVPDGFEPDEGVLQARSPFEAILADLEREGAEKRAVVARINELTAELGVSTDAAAVVYGRRKGIDVANAARRGRNDL